MQLLKQKSAIFNNSGSYSMTYNAYMYDLQKHTEIYQIVTIWYIWTSSSGGSGPAEAGYNL